MSHIIDRREKLLIRTYQGGKKVNSKLRKLQIWSSPTLSYFIHNTQPIFYNL